MTARPGSPSLEADEREKTGIRNLKVGYNSVFGYYLEVTKPNLHLVPDDYIRKQTTTNSERFITPALKEMEAKVLGADDKAKELEYTIFCEVRSKSRRRGPQGRESRSRGRRDRRALGPRRDRRVQGLREAGRRRRRGDSRSRTAGIRWSSTSSRSDSCRTTRS